MTTKTKDPEARASLKIEALERAYLELRAEIRADESLSWEKKELAIRQLGLEYDRKHKHVQEDAA